MTKMTYEEAKKAAKTAKAAENFMVLTVKHKLLVPYSEGVKALTALSTAQRLSDWRDDEPARPLTHESLTTEVMSAEEYEMHKIAALMGVTVYDVKQAKEAAKTT